MAENKKQKDERIIEHEENRQKNFDYVIWELEQRTEKLEQNFQSISVNLTGQLTDEVAQRFNMNLAKYLPKVSMDLSGL